MMGIFFYDDGPFCFITAGYFVHRWR